MSELDTRLNNRPLDLRLPRNQAIFRIHDQMLISIREVLNKKRFTEVITPKIIGSATEGGTELFPIMYFDKEAFLTQSAQLFDISGDKMELLLDFPTIGEPHYAQGIAASKVKPNSKKIYPLEENEHPYKALGEKFTRVERDGNIVHIYMTSIRSHFSPDNIEGIRVGDKVYVHLTNLEQDFDVPHGLAIQGARNAELLVMPGQTETIYWEPQFEGVFPFYCTDFCSALHQEMQGYARVSAANSNVALKFGLN